MKKWVNLIRDGYDYFHLPGEFKTFQHGGVWQSSIFDIDKQLPNPAFLDITKFDWALLL